MNMHISTTLHSAPENPEEFLNSVTLPDTVAEKLRLQYDLYLAGMVAIDAVRAEAESATQILEIEPSERNAARRAKAMSKVELRIADGDTSKKLVTASVKHLKSLQFIPATAEGAGWLHRVRRASGEVVDQTAPASILDVTLVETGLPKGKPGEIVDAQRGEVDVLRAKRNEIENAYEPAEMVKNSLRNQVDALDRSARIGVSINPQSRPKIEWPTQVLEGVTTSRASGNRVHIPDIPALLCRFNREAVLAELFAAVDAQYEGVGKTYEPHERKRELKRIDAAILEAERIECEAIWQAIKAGDTSLRFRAETDTGHCSASPDQPSRPCMGLPRGGSSRSADDRAGLVGRPGHHPDSHSARGGARTTEQDDEPYQHHRQRDGLARLFLRRCRRDDQPVRRGA